MDYQEFLMGKHLRPAVAGFQVDESAISPTLFPFQRDVVRWAAHLGRAALFEERGLGKTIQEFEWATLVHRHTGGKVLILTPLAVAFQMLMEADKFGYSLIYAESQADVGDNWLVVTNYERLHEFDPSAFVGVVLDESSILKNFTGKTKQALFKAFAKTQYKLCASATPAPNDHLELGNHADFLGIMPSNEMIARWFINDTMKAGEYRLKRHGERDFWRWVTSWAVCISHPRDLGSQYNMDGYDLPKLHVHEHLVETSLQTIERTHASGRLLVDGRPSSTELHKVKRESLEQRIDRSLEITAALPEDEYLILWCETNDEADALIAAYPKALEVRGSHSHKIKQERLKAFTQGEVKQIITKADIAGMGLNWQHCAQQVFVGVSYSFEKLYQALGRSYRYGQTREVHAHLLYSEAEVNVMDTIKRKQDDFKVMQTAMSEIMQEEGLFRDKNTRKLIHANGTIPMILPDWIYTRKVPQNG